MHAVCTYKTEKMTCEIADGLSQNVLNFLESSFAVLS
jgi:hypothetical protein